MKYFVLAKKGKTSVKIPLMRDEGQDMAIRMAGHLIDFGWHDVSVDSFEV